MTNKEENKKDYVCPFCQKQLGSRQTLWRHLKTCPAKPDDEANVKETEDGLKLFEDDNDDKPDVGQAETVKPKKTKKVKEEEEEEEEYEEPYFCPICKHVEGSPFPICPDCGTELVWQE